MQEFSKHEVRVLKGKVCPLCSSVSISQPIMNNYNCNSCDWSWLGRSGELKQKNEPD